MEDRLIDMKDGVRIEERWTEDRQKTNGRWAKDEG
jgi:hypothetical protein